MSGVLKAIARTRSRRGTGHGRIRIAAWSTMGLACLLIGLGAAVSSGLGRYVPGAPAISWQSGRVGPGQASPSVTMTRAHGIALPDIGPAILDEIEVGPETGGHEALDEAGAGGTSGFPSRIPNPHETCLDLYDQLLWNRSAGDDPVLEVNQAEGSCRIVEGAWIDPWTGQVIRDVSEMAVVPVVPFAEAMRSGAGEWPDEWLVSYASDLDTPWALLPVSLESARVRGGRDIAHWLPEDPRLRCDYVLMWAAVKYRWRLRADADEMSVMRRTLNDCL